MKPTSTERRLVGRCFQEFGILIGSIDEIWTHPLAERGLETLRHCIDAITLIYGGRHAVRSSTVVACVMQSDGLSKAPLHLEDFADFLCDDGEARRYWQAICTDDMFPHRCPKCGAAAFIGFLQIECKAKCETGPG